MQNTMKHIWMLLLPLAVLVASCHRDEPRKKVAMNFTSSVVAEGTISPLQNNPSAQGAPVRRAPMDATPLEEKGINSFRVWCYKTMAYNSGTGVYSNHQNVMNRYIVEWKTNTSGTTASNTADWEYVGVENSDVSGGRQLIKYWDFGATSYRFFGFAPHDETGIEYGQGGNTEPREDSEHNWWYDISFQADADDPEQAPYISKLWFSNNMGERVFGDQVVMEFLKPVTKVRIELYSNEGVKIEDPQEELGLAELLFKPTTGESRIVTAGQLRVSYAITGPVTIAHYTPFVNVIGDPTGTIEIKRSDEHYDEFYNVLPHVTQGTYSLVYAVGGEQKMATVPAQYMSWQPNMQYTYRFKMMDGSFQFIDIVQIGVTSWKTEESIHDIFNW